MGNLNKVTYVDHQTVITAGNLNDIQDAVIQNTSYTTCSTAANTAAKTSALTNFVLTTGSAVKVKFTNTNTAANPTLNVNSTGAKPIMQYGTTVAGTTATDSWDDGAVVEFVYDGTNWVMQGRNTIDAVSKSAGGTFDGNVQINRADGTTSSRGWSALEVGNNTAEGSNGNSTGLLRVWGATDKKTDIYHASTTPTANQYLILPDASGTIALTDNPTNIAIRNANGVANQDNLLALTLGNPTPKSQAGHSEGFIASYGDNGYYTAIQANDATANRQIRFPDASGILSLVSDIGFINKGTVSIGGALSDIETWVKANFATNRWVVARVTPTSSGYFGSSSFDIMANCSSANYGWGYCHSDNPTADGHLYFRLGAGQFFWKKVMMCPANSAANDLSSQNFFTGVTGLTVVAKSFLCTTSIASLYLHLRKTDSTSFGWGRTNVGTLASGYRPMQATGASGCGSEAVGSYPNRNIYINVQTDGTIYIDNFNNDTKSFYVRITYFYV